MIASCRFCGTPLKQTLVDLGTTPLANSYLSGLDAIAEERSFPLHVMVCNTCWLVQTTETVPADVIFNHGYAYLSSYSTGWVAHAKAYAEAMVKRLALGEESQVVEIASNDGYLLQHFVAMGVPVLGIEPAGHAAEIAIVKGVETEVAFFGEKTARRLCTEGVAADLMVANNVLAHVPDIRDFAQGIRLLLAQHGIATFEFPHLANLVENVQFDTIYHEHYSYLSLAFVETLLQTVSMEIFDVETLPTHGGSLRVFAGHDGVHAESPAVRALRAQEMATRLAEPAGYAGFAARVESLVSGFLSFLQTARREGKVVVGYGAAAKGNTFLNVAGVSATLLEFVVDRNPEKQGTLLPGSHIPVRPIEDVAKAKPDYLVILPWNIAPEIIEQQAGIRDWGGRFVTAVPELRIS